MATTAKGIVPDTKAEGQKRRKPMPNARKAKLVAALADWRASMTEQERAEQAERSRQQHKARWEGMSKKERDARLAGVRAWQAEQRAAKAAKAKATPKVAPKAKARKGSRAASVGESAVEVEVIGPDGTSKPSPAR